MIDTLTSNMLYLNEKCRYYREEKNKYWWGLKVIAEDKVRHERLLRETVSSRQLLESYIQIAKQTLGGNPPLEFEREGSYAAVYDPFIGRNRKA